MEVTIGYYIFGLLTISFMFFFAVASLIGGTNEPYRDLLLTIAVGQFVMSKLIIIKKKE
ncbi:hypothetical protein [Bacillus infantis]|uniref:hypothetical protein n=1 Tax=Bacillus infantis TaxID=324767 RepID=UPI002155E594|nr:hypothetical protein [Bacillus infantis]MCR6609544.1 hypothetical protein [Bacillus infantis]